MFGGSEVLFSNHVSFSLPVFINNKSVILLALLHLVFSPAVLADTRGTDVDGKPVILHDNGTWSYVPPSAGKGETCQNYTSYAIAQQRSNQSSSCGFAGKHWHQVSNTHFNWCMGVGAARRSAQTKARRDGLARCAKTKKTKACRIYTDDAILQQQANLKRRCNYVGARWHQDSKAHFNWCMGVKAASRANKAKNRRDELVRCTQRLKVKACQAHSINATAQQGANKSNHCGFTGVSWNPSQNYHFNWCMQVCPKSRAVRTKARRDALLKCTRSGRSPITGNWTSRGEKMHFPDVTRGLVRASYARDGGRILADLKGRLLTGIWVENGSDVRCKTRRDGSYHWGRMVFIFNQAFSQFKGKWGYCQGKPTTKWTGRKL